VLIIPVHVYIQVFISYICGAGAFSGVYYSQHNLTETIDTINKGTQKIKMHQTKKDAKLSICICIGTCIINICDDLLGYIHENYRHN
jgi:hypothetical protein